MNRAIIIGRLTKDPQGGETNAGKSWAKFTVAVNRMNDGADFINVLAWDKTAQNCLKFLAKGKQVAVEGRIQTGSYEGRDGVKRQTFDVVADRVEFLAGGEQKANKDGSIDDLQEVDEDDDCPF